MDYVVGAKKKVEVIVPADEEKTFVNKGLSSLSVCYKGSDIPLVISPCGGHLVRGPGEYEVFLTNTIGEDVTLEVN